MRIALIYNPLSGRRHGRRVEQIDAVARVFESAGHELTKWPTERPGHAEEIASRIQANHEMIVSAGGDGTAHEIVQALAGSGAECALGVLPFGTGNVLAKDLGLPIDALAAARKLLSYTPRRIAAGRIEFARGSGRASRWFTVAAGIGAHARLIYDAGAQVKKRGGMFAYYYTGFHSLFTFKFVPMKVVLTNAHGETLERTAVEAVGMRVSSFGGWLKRWRPGGALTSDELKVILLTRAERGALFRYALAAFAGKTREAAGIEFHSATKVECSLLEEGGAVHTQADGEMLGRGPIKMEIVPRAFRLMMP